MKTLILCLTLTAVSATAQEHNCGMQSMNARGDQAMGFSHEKTTHHFLLRKDGGAIEASANDAADKESRDDIRMHMQHIAHAFASGDFDIPMFIHGHMPPGAREMQRRKAKITYRYEESDGGGRVVIFTEDRRALKAIHDFLRFQIADHETGDPSEEP
jgi:hypothetical protein